MKCKPIAGVLLTIGLISCRKNMDEHSAALTISGIYEAKTYQSFGNVITYPINGQTISLQINPVSKDSVRVQINSTFNGFYSPGNAAIYPEVYVEESICSNCQHYSIYEISLAPQVHPGTLENTIWVDPDNNAYYTYIPPNDNAGAVQTIFVKTN
jgi:hypothetical protein